MARKSKGAFFSRNRRALRKQMLNDRIIAKNKLVHNMMTDILVRS